MARVYVGHIPYEARERDVERFFDGYGKIRDILMKRGYCFVELSDSRNADDAVDELNGKSMMGMRVIVEMAKGRPRAGGARGAARSRSRSRSPRRAERRRSPSPRARRSASPAAQPDSSPAAAASPAQHASASPASSAASASPLRLPLLRLPLKDPSPRRPRSRGMSFKYKTRRLDGRVALITDGTNGLGLAIADRLGHEGARVLVGGARPAAVEAALRRLAAGGIPAAQLAGAAGDAAADADQERLLRQAHARFGRLDILVLNHDVRPPAGALMDVPEPVWDRLFAVNCRSFFTLTQKAAAYLRQSGGGTIVYTASVAGYKPPPQLALYGVTKTVLLAMTKAFAQDLAEFNIRVNSVAPGLIRADRGGAHWDEALTPLADLKSPDPANDMGRAGSPEEVAAAVAYLVSDDSSYVTGESHVVSGGVGCRL